MKPMEAYYEIRSGVIEVVSSAIADLPLEGYIHLPWHEFDFRLGSYKTGLRTPTGAEYELFSPMRRDDTAQDIAMRIAQEARRVIANYV